MEASSGNLLTHPALVTEDLLSQFVKSPELTELTKEAREWLPSMLDGGALKIIAALSATQRSLHLDSLSFIILRNCHLGFNGAENLFIVGFFMKFHAVHEETLQWIEF